MNADHSIACGVFTNDDGLCTCKEDPAATATAEWERIFAEKIQHEDGCPFQHGDENADGHVECECYVTELWDAVVDETDRLRGALRAIDTYAKRLRIDQGRGLSAHITEALRDA